MEDSYSIPRMLTANDVAGILEVSSRTVRTMAHSGRMPAPVTGTRRLRWHPHTIDRWLRGEWQPRPQCRRRGRPRQTSSDMAGGRKHS